MKVLEFIELIKKKKKNDAEIANRTKEERRYSFNDFTDRIKFHLSYTKTCPAVGVDLGGNLRHLIALDEEDVEYLRKKYSKHLNEEKNKELEKIRNKYDNVKDIE